MCTKMFVILLLLFVCEVQSEGKEGKETTYRIDVKTGSRKYSGTDSKVFIIIYGENGDTGKIMLTSSETNGGNYKFNRYRRDRFTEAGLDVGRITKIRIGHDNSGSGPGWYLDKVVIKVGDTKCEMTFTANRWVMKGALQAELSPTFNQHNCKKGKKTTYHIDVETGSRKYSGTDAKVFIIIYGEKGDTGKIMLKSSQFNKGNAKFNQYKTDRFTEEGFKVGRITKIRIGHDNSGGGAGWYLDKVVINVGDLRCDLTFTANRWVHTGALQADLYPTFNKQKCKKGTKTTYHIDVKTGSIKYSGTDANVFITIYGEKGDTGKIMLASSETNKGNYKFNQYKMDRFTVEGLDVGRINKIRIGHDNSGGGPGWYLDKVVIKVGDTKCQITFNAYRWVMVGALQADLLPHYNVKNCNKGKKTKYNIDVKTGNVNMAGTDGKVFIIIYGEKGDTGKIILRSSKTNKDKFEQNDLDKFTEVGFDVGRISKIRIGHDNAGKNPGWYLGKVVINVDRTKCEITFTANRWVMKGALEANLYPTFDTKKCNQGKMIKYDIDVKTSNVKYAGTDANVFIIIYGEKVDTGKLILRKSKTHSDQFEQSDLDKFTEEAIDVGRITKIRIGHDNTKSGAGWHLERVAVGVQGKNCKLSFYAGEWLVKKNLQVDLYPTLSANTCDNKLTTYEINVKTSNKKNAGTDAHVFIIIYGKKGNTGKLALRNSKNHKDPFERNQLDSFTGKAIDVGRISAIRIGHDNKGSYAGWSIDNVVIKVKSCTSTFSAWQWLEKGKLVFDIYPTLEQGKCKEKTTSSGSICRRDYRKIGCFSRNWDKVPDLLVTDIDPSHKNFTTSMNWNNFALGLHSLACRCRAKAVGTYKYFGIGFNGECVAGKDSAGLEKMFAAQKGKKGASGCINGKRETCKNGEETECTGVEDFDFFYEIVE